MRIVKINTTAYSEEDFMLLTNLSDAQIKKVIAPMVKKERKGDVFYTNEDYYWTLKEVFPKANIDLYTEDSIEELTF